MVRPQFLLTGYIERALHQAVFEKLDDGTYSGRIPACTGVVAFADTLRGCEDELRSTLEDWVWMGLKFGHQLPVIDDIDLNRAPADESLASM